MDIGAFPIIFLYYLNDKIEINISINSKNNLMHQTDER